MLNQESPNSSIDSTVDSKGDSEFSKNDSNRGAIPAFIARIAPFVLPALFFESAILAFISPLPLFILTLKKDTRTGVLALLTNCAALYAATYQQVPRGTLSGEFILGALFWMICGVVFPTLIRKIGRIRESFGISFLISALVLAGFLLHYSHQVGMHPVDYVRSQISQGLDHLVAMPDSPVKKLIEEQGRDPVYRQLLTEVPSGILISIIIALWINLLFASQILKSFLSRAFWANYKNPEWLLIPTLLSVGLFVIGLYWPEYTAPYYIGLNSLKVFLVFYGFQGLSILSHLLNRYKVLGLGRAILFSIAIFVAMPLVLSLGFFDLWFDFRKKFGHS